MQTCGVSYSPAAQLTTFPVLSISPSSPVEAVDDLVCTLDTPSIDPDGNPITYTFDWTVDGIAYGGAPSTTTYTDDTIAASETTGGEVWECTVTPNDGTEDGYSATDHVTVTTVTTGKIVFVTSQTHSGDFGGISGADAFCQTSASNAGLSGTFYAWLSGSSYSTSPAARFTQSAIPYELTDGTVVANDWADLTGGSINHAINIDEYGNSSSSSFVFSFTQTDGSPGLFGSANSSCYGDDCHCNNWTNSNGQGSPIPGSAVGQVNSTNDDWTDYSFVNSCGPSGWAIYCFEQ
jgi:hypothetical protein